MKPSEVIVATTAASATAAATLAAPAILTVAGFGANGLVAGSAVAPSQAAGAVGALAAAGPVAVIVGASIAGVGAVTAAGFAIAKELARHDMGRPGALDKTRNYVVVAEVSYHRVIFISFETRKAAHACMARGRAVRRVTAATG